ncbi:MAG: PLP-dependent aminotransferase family protein [Ilumatobacteraceae bacterium]
MASKWTSLAIELDPTIGRRAALEQSIRGAIRDGRLQPGDSTASTRALAHNLGVARGTVVDAFEQLVAEGWLTSRPGAATTVALGVESTRSTSPGGPRPPTSVPPLIDLRPRSPDVSAFPRRDWAAALRHVLRSAPDEAMGYGSPIGRIELREALAEMLRRVRGVVVDPDHVVICSGYTHGLGLVASALSQRGVRSIAMEDPTARHHREVVASRGMTVTRLAVDELGARTDLLWSLDVGAVVLTPSHQHPLGVALAPTRRASLVGWLESTNGFVIEDDYDGEFRYDRQPLTALQSRAPERIIYAGTASKTLAPGIRLGWLVVPRALMTHVADAALLSGSTPSTIDQIALAHLLTSGGYERQVRKQRLAYQRRRNALIARLAADVPTVTVEGLDAGLHAVLRLPPGADERHLIAAAAERHLLVEGLGAFWHRPGPHRQALLISYAAPPEHAVRTVLDRLVDTLTTNISNSRSSTGSG